MARLFETAEGGYAFTPDEQEFIILNENNYLANLHRDQNWMDRVGVEDPSDQQWWTWFRADTDPDIFNQMVEVAYMVGSVLIRSTGLVEVDAQFNKRHEVTDQEIEDFYGTERDNPGAD